MHSRPQLADRACLLRCGPGRTEARPAAASAPAPAGACTCTCACAGASGASARRSTATGGGRACRSSATELAARRRAAAARAQQARLRAQRLRAARSAALKKAQQRKLEATTRASQQAGLGSPRSPTTKAAPFLLAGLFGAVLLLGLALTPARAVPSSRASRALEDRREEIAALGAMGLFATGLLFFFVTIVAR